MNKSREQKLLRFDPTVATDEEIRAWLFAIIDAELEKNEDEEIDMELIKECSDCEAYLSHDNAEMSEEEYAEGLARIKERAKAMEAEIEAASKKASFIGSLSKIRFGMRRNVAIIAAVIATVLIFSMVALAALKVTGKLDFMVENVKSILGMDSGDTIDDGKITLIKDDLAAEYSSVEEALREGGCSGVLYPTVLPDNAKIERIVQTHKEDKTQYDISFVTNSKDISYGVSNYKQIGLENWDNVEIRPINNVTYHIVYAEDLGRYQAGCYYNGYECIISCSNYDDLIGMLNSMKELKQ